MNKRHNIVTTMSRKDPQTVIVSVTPEMATRWLALNAGDNRNISVATVNAYAGEMAADRWVLTHQAIAFNVDGQLVDGQHRLQAVVQSGKTVRMHVTMGLHIAYNSPIDIGYNRRADHILGKPSRWVSIARGLILMESGDLGKSFKAQIGQIADVGERHEEHIDAISEKLEGHVLMGVVAACVWAHPVAPKMVETFTEQVSTGELLTKGDPAYSLRRWMHAGDRHSTKEAIIAGCAALRYTLQKKTLTKLPGGREAEQKDGYTHYAWLCQKRRVIKAPGTPAFELVNMRGEAQDDE